jgi:hypothetical protein
MRSWIDNTVFHHWCPPLQRAQQKDITYLKILPFSLPVLSYPIRLNILLFQAVKTGNILVIDEADKAPTNVTCILKSLAENGEMILSGRRHCAGANRLLAEVSDTAQAPTASISWLKLATLRRR